LSRINENKYYIIIFGTPFQGILKQHDMLIFAYNIIYFMKDAALEQNLLLHLSGADGIVGP